MDRALEDVVRERSRNRNSNSNSRRGPRGGVRKPGRNNGNSYDESRLWVHDKFDGDTPRDSFRSNKSDRGAGEGGRRNPSDTRIPTNGAKVKVENIHYDLGEEDLLSLFRRKGPVLKLELLYDRAGRSEGTAFVIFEHEDDAHQAIREFDGANANGQPISLSIVGRGSSRSEPPASRSLFDRIQSPERTDSRNRDTRRDPTRKPTPPGIDRYVPPERRRRRDSNGRERERERRPAPRDDRADRGDRGDRERGGNSRRGQGRGTNTGSGGGSVRPKKTVEELDAEMQDYFSNMNEESGDGAAAPVQQPIQQAAVDEDEEMVL